ncbi:hypothetical protein AGMMS49982_02870 [Bacteroidia bacterium]|nr:hypothetical protein AGMMS49982_02870 [Bacteroidia bacterium]
MDKKFFEKIFSEKRMEKYFIRYENTNKAILHYQCNIELAESFYPCLTVFEVVLRNSVNRELIKLFGKDDWYLQIATTPGLTNLNRYITQASKQITGRNEHLSPSKITAELTLGFWVSLFNAEYELILWKDLRRAFPNMPKSERQRKKVAPALNRFRAFRNRIFHHEPISWNLEQTKQIHEEMLAVITWMNDELPEWVAAFDRFEQVYERVKKQLTQGICGSNSQ